MPKKSKKKGKTAPKTKKQSPIKPKKTKSFSEEEIKAYISAYIDAYMDYVEELSLNESDYPLFYTSYPFDIKGYMLPDKSTCILFSGLADSTVIEMGKADFDSVEQEMALKKYDHICCYSPGHSYTKEEAIKQAKKDVDRDVESTKQLGETDREAKEDALRSIRLLGVAVPWVSEREIAVIGEEIPKGSRPAVFANEDLRIKDNEDFSSYSERLKNLETEYLQVPKEEPILDEQPQEPPPPPQSEELPPPDKTVVTKATAPPQPPPAPPPVKEAPKPTQVPIPPPGPPTNISIEIKQPEVSGRGEAEESRKDIEILRLKKTLYIQTTEMDALKKEMKEMSINLGNVEHMRQTVFRMNRKVHDTDAKMIEMERSNKDLMMIIAEMRSEQMEENKKMRRFISEKSRKARNQAMIVGGIAITLSAICLILLVPLLVEFWDQIKHVLGL